MPWCPGFSRLPRTLKPATSSPRPPRSSRGRIVVEAFWQRDHSPENSVGANWGGEFLTRDFGGIATGGRWTSVWTNSLTSRVNVAFNDKGIGAQASGDLTSRNVHQNVFASAGRLVGTGTLVILDSVPSVGDSTRAEADAVSRRHLVPRFACRLARAAGRRVSPAASP